MGKRPAQWIPDLNVARGKCKTCGKCRVGGSKTLCPACLASLRAKSAERRRLKAAGLLWYDRLP